MHPIKFVAKRTGLSAHVIRIWERRYGVVKPERTPSNRRLYSEADIERLTLLRKATEAGHNISQLARMSLEQLREIITSSTLPAARPLNPSIFAPSENVPLSESLEAVSRLDGALLEKILAQATLKHSPTVLIEKLIVPLMVGIGDQWSEGTLRPAHEHLATAIVRSFVTNIVGAYHPATAAPRLIVTTPAGQWHELGALLVTATAAAQGWQVTYLGPNLPAEEIAGAALQGKAQAVALSIVYPGDDANLPFELRRLHELLPSQVKLLVGGRCARNYEKVLDEISATKIRDIAHLRTELLALRA